MLSTAPWNVVAVETTDRTQSFEPSFVESIARRKSAEAELSTLIVLHLANTGLQNLT